MRQRFLVALACAASLSIANLAAAQTVPATLLLKSGDRVTGRFVDMGRRDFYMQVNGQERRVPIGDVAVIDFSGNAQNLPADEADRARSGRNVLVTRGGEIVEGRLSDVGGKNPLRFTFTTAGRDREFGSNELSRIYLARPGNNIATGTAGDEAVGPGARTISVPANRQWTSTGIVVRKGDFPRFSSSGEIRLSPNAGDTAGVNGKTGAYAVRATAPRVLLGGLLGRVGNGDPFGIGGQPSVQMPDSGELFLGVNDASFGDNSGEFRVVIGTGSERTGDRAVPRRRR